MKTIGLEMTTIFEFFEISFSPCKRMSMGIEKFCGPDSRKYYYGVID